MRRARAAPRCAADFDAFLESWRSAGLLGTPCTSVWTVGAIAYRCRTCQVRETEACGGKLCGVHARTALL
jgi:hypothetical protein